MRHRWLHYKTEHLLYFSRKVIRRLLEETGFRVISVRYEGKHIGLDYFLRRLRVYLPPIGRLVDRLLVIPLVRRFYFYINPFDFMLLLAQKTDTAESQQKPD
jgi:8-oxo-dGTP pyrophosphatase MutT (NUDIX family)